MSEASDKNLFQFKCVEALKQLHESLVNLQKRHYDFVSLQKLLISSPSIHNSGLNYPPFFKVAKNPIYYYIFCIMYSFTIIIIIGFFEIFLMIFSLIGLHIISKLWSRFLGLFPKIVDFRETIMYSLKRYHNSKLTRESSLFLKCLGRFDNVVS